MNQPGFLRHRGLRRRSWPVLLIVRQLLQLLDQSDAVADAVELQDAFGEALVVCELWLLVEEVLLENDQFFNELVERVLAFIFPLKLEFRIGACLQHIHHTRREVRIFRIERIHRDLIELLGEDTPDRRVYHWSAVLLEKSLLHLDLIFNEQYVRNYAQLALSALVPARQFKILFCINQDDLDEHVLLNSEKSLQLRLQVINTDRGFIDLDNDERSSAIERFNLSGLHY